MRLVSVISVLVLLCMSSCGSQEDTIPSQINAIERYLRSQGVYSQQEYEQDVTGTITKYYTVQNGVYKYIVNRDREDRPDESLQSETGDSIILRFAAYVLSGSRPALYYTNIPELVDGVANLNTQYWSFEPLRVKIGTTPIIKGMANALPYCQKGDSVVLFATSDLGFDDDPVGTVPINSTLMFGLNVENVIKQ